MYVSRTGWIKPPYLVGKNDNVFAIGDIHGHAEELLAIYEVIRTEIGDKNNKNIIVHLGDYIDRGPVQNRF